MQPIHLVDDLLTGVDAIDRDHRNLFQVANRLLTSQDVAGEAKGLDDLVRGLMRYVNSHLEEEEALAVANGYPAADRLAKGHDLLRAKAQDILEDMSLYGPSKQIYLRAHMLIADDFVAHIRTQDRGLAEFLKRRRT
jgi:hemerythrin